jgi:hypothetical protein
LTFDPPDALEATLDVASNWEARSNQSRNEGGSEKGGLAFRMVVGAQWLRYALHEVGVGVNPLSRSGDMSSSVGTSASKSESFVELWVSPDKVVFRTARDTGTVEVELPKSAALLHSLDIYECDAEYPLKSRYYMKSLIAITKCALNLSTKVAIRSDAYQFLNFQCLVPLPMKQSETCFLEYLIAPIAD